MTNNIISLNANHNDPLAAELTAWLIDRGVPVAEAYRIVKRTLQKLSPLRGMSLKVKLVPESDPSKTINLSETLTEGITDALAPLIHSLAHDRVGLEYLLWQQKKTGQTQ